MAKNNLSSEIEVLCGYAAERSAIKGSRSKRTGEEGIDELRALSLSGGGIRSATFALGVLNKLAEDDGAQLRKIDYLSTVSGGGYLGAFVGRLFQSYGSTSLRDVYQRLSDTSSENLQYLRRNGRYLAKNGDEGAVALATYVRNFIWLHLLLVPVLMVLFIAVFYLRSKWVANNFCQPFAWLSAVDFNNRPLQLLQQVPFEWLVSIVLVALYLLSVPVYFLLAGKAYSALRMIVKAQGWLFSSALIAVGFSLLSESGLYIYHLHDNWLHYTVSFNVVLLTLVYKFFTKLNQVAEHIRIASWLAGALALFILINYLLLVAIGAAAVFDKAELFQQERFLSSLAVVAAMILLSVKYDFINRTSLHAFYSARLRRAYLGAANIERFTKESVTPLVNHHDKDDCELKEYKPHEKGGPLHIINVTVNNKLSPHSQLWQPDRQGANLAVSAVSASVGQHFHRTKHTESVSVSHRSLKLAQWIAISGAAASTGMGRLTSWYSSIITALLNIRLGYWWKPSASWTERFYRSFFTEFSNRYSASINSERAVKEHWHLSDGGHFENLAVYEMIKRQIPRIMVLDAGQDKAFSYDDLANLIRHARIDFDYEFTIASPEEIKAVFPTPAESGLLGTLSELKSTPEQFAQKRACLLVGRYAGNHSPSELKPNRDIHLLYIKPTLTGSEPVDVMQYHTEFPDYPHESTADQFFDEPQWESYRKLGYHTATELQQVINTFLRSSQNI